MIGGLVVLAVVLVAASAAGLVLRRRQGRFQAVSSDTEGRAPSSGLSDAEARTGPGRPQASGTLSPEDLGAPLGARATLVQFSTEVCAYCGPTRQLLTEVAGERDGVAFVEIDAADRMDLTRRLHVLATPTVLVLDAAGGITSRASGPVRRAELLAAVGQAAGPAYAPEPDGDRARAGE